MTFASSGDRSHCYDVILLGSGCASSLLGMALAQRGRRVLMVDPQRHPRFAIGESSTPLADLSLRMFAHEYELPELLPLTAYGRWRAAYPELRCGLKRGFSYFYHEPDRAFSTTENHDHELLVAASATDATSDTHWLRADVDQFLAQRATARGVEVLEGTTPTILQRGPWRLQLQHCNDRQLVEAPFVVDGTGPASVVARHLGLTSQVAELATHSRAIYAHVTGRTSWGDCLERAGQSVADHPFACDHAAVHHVLAEGWMWQLPFEHGVTSVGFALADRPTAAVSADDECRQLLARYPSLQQQLANVEVISPGEKWLSLPRMQRLWNCAAGDDWALLPSTAGFIDPLHSSGIAHSISGVRRLAAMLLANETSQAELRLAYSYDVPREIRLVDQLVASCYATRRNFAGWVAATMLYFALAIRSERKVLAGAPASFLDADLPDVQQFAATGTTMALQADHAALGPLLQEFCRVPLLDPAARNMYSRTAAEK